MFKSHWIDEKKYKVSMELLYEIKNNKLITKEAYKYLAGHL